MKWTRPLCGSAVISQNDFKTSETIQSQEASPMKKLRACLKRSRSRCETPHHQLNHGDSDPRLRGLRQGLKVFTQPPRAMEPAKRAFDNPTPLHHLKALGVPGAFHNHENALQDR